MKEISKKLGKNLKRIDWRKKTNQQMKKVLDNLLKEYRIFRV